MNWKLEDKNVEQEAQKYGNPIPSREFILTHLDKRGKPATRQELFVEFGIEDENEQIAVHRRLRAMERDGQLIFTRKKSYALVSKLNLIRGRVSANKDGFGFLVNEKGGEDLYISPKQMRKLFDGDVILASASQFNRKGRMSIDVVEILERAHTEIVGKLYIDEGVYLVSPNNSKIAHQIVIPPGNTNKARDGQLIVVEILKYPTERFPATGKIVKVLGDELAPGMEIDVAIETFNIPYEFGVDVINQAKKIFTHVTNKDIDSNRRDLRMLPFVTIDDITARDFDDAVYCDVSSTGFKLYVAIADVSHYILKDDAIDNEANKRGNSVYFAGRVVPMLPEQLSNGICSLNPKVDRLTLVCELNINEQGLVETYEFYDAVIHSHARLTYQQVGDFLNLETNKQQTTANVDKQGLWSRIKNMFYEENKTLEYGITEDLAPYIQNLFKVYQALHQQRIMRGSIDLEIPEPQIIFDDNSKIKTIVTRNRNDAHKMIEEAMLAANVAAAEFLQTRDIPVIYRVHNKPPHDKFEGLKRFLNMRGISFMQADSEHVTSKDYAQVLQSVHGRIDFSIIQNMILRSMSQSLYSTENIGHFALNYTGYVHFTSPIRRLPDLIVHRAIKSVIRQDEYNYDLHSLNKIAEHASMTERRADDATRNVISWLKCEFMSSKIGDVFSSTIISVTNFGVFVELNDIYIEGLIHVTSLKSDYYNFHANTQTLTGERFGNVYRIGDVLEVIVARVSLDDRKIDFELVH